MNDRIEGIEIRRDLIYAEAERPLRYDLYRAKDCPDDAPHVLLLHGGGWRFGDKGMMADAANAFVRQGFVAIAIEYRLLGEMPWPVPLEDVCRAIAAARAGTIGPGGSAPLFLAGYSAGAHLALLAAARNPDAVSGVAAFFPPARLGPQHAGALGLSAGADLSPFNPIDHAGLLPPTILFCGDADAMTPASDVAALHSAIRAAGGMADLRLFSGLIHEFVSLPGMMDITVRDAVEFFGRTALRKPAFDQALEDLRQWWTKLMSGRP